MSVNLSKSIIVIMFFFFMVLAPKRGLGVGDLEDRDAVIAGYGLVETFYACLVSKELHDVCGDILDIEPYKDSEMNSVWKYIKIYQGLFVSQYSKIKDEEFFKWARKSITYFNPRDIGNITDGQLYVSVVHSLPGYNDSGIYKEISFPIVKIKNGKYKVVFGNIKVNGILLNYENELVRDFDIVEMLGFENSKGGIAGGKGVSP